MKKTRTRNPQRPTDRGPRLAAFAPLVGTAPRILILGSLPGAASLAAAEYYAHPRNLFWDLMGELFGVHRGLPYPERVARITAAGVAVWDVVQEAHRPGSLDSDIHHDTVVASDIAGLVAAHPMLRTIAFNGQTSATLFRRHVLKAWPDPERFTFLTLPSTSPAHAGRSRAEKLALWRAVKAAVEPPPPALPERDKLRTRRRQR